MGATDVTTPVPPGGLSTAEWLPGSIIAAALVLPGVYVPVAQAQTPPEQGVVAIKYLHYQDSQPGLKRIKVDSPALYLKTPVGSNWSIEASAVVDVLSGATPRWQSNVSSASVLKERRNAADVKVTRYFDRAAFSVGTSYSTENDYVSNAVSLEASVSSEDNNRTWTLGLGAASDRIDPTSGAQVSIGKEKKTTGEVIVGVTQALSKTDIAQVNLSFARGTGYFSDPYKSFDNRPRERNQTALLARWNHFFEGDQSTLRTSYRFYHDSFGIDAHTLQLEWVKPLSERFSLTPLLRLYSQSAASFYAEAQTDLLGFPVFPTLLPGQLNSGDQRLSAFGAVTLGLKAEYRFTPSWSVDAKVEGYEQRSKWQLGGQGSPGVDTFRATSVQLGTSHKF